MYNSREALRRSTLPFTGHLLERKYRDDHPPTIEQLESCWGEYRAISGEPVYVFAEECIEYYPDAKVILTVRDDEEKWFSSLEQTIWYGHTRWVSKVLPYISPVHANMNRFVTPFFRYLLLGDVPNHAIRWYREHNAMVQRLAGDRCLVFNARDGWEPLCLFLGKEVPNVPFPHVNQRDEHRNTFSKARKDALVKALGKATVNVGILAGVFGFVWWQRLRIRSFVRGLRR